MKQLLGVLVFLAVCAARLLSQTPAQTDLILKRLEALEQQNAELLAEVKALRQAITPASATPSSTLESIEERQQVSEHRIEELAQTKVETSQRFPVQLTGTALFNVFENGGHSGGVQDPTVASLSAAARSSGASFRQTVLGLKYGGPQTLLGGAVSGSLYMDFFGGSAASLNHLLRLRVATLQVDWLHTTFAVGQDKPLVSRREPNSFAQVGVSPLTGAGNPWLWQPQARLEQRFQVAAQTEVKAEGGIFLTAEPNTLNTPVEPARPAFESRLSVRQSWGDDHSLELAPVFHASTSHINGQSIPSRLYGLDWLIRPAPKWEITGLLFHGRNFANLGALGGVTLLGSGNVVAVHGSGGWLQLRYRATQKLSFDAYGGQQDDRNRDLQPGQIGKNQYYAGNVVYLLAPNVVSAFEFGQNHTAYLGAGNRLNNHYDLALGYLF